MKKTLAALTAPVLLCLLLAQDAMAQAPAATDEPATEATPIDAPPKLFRDTLQAHYADEGLDGGVAATAQMRRSNIHSMTPLAVAGAKTITTRELAQMIDSDTKPVVVDVLGGKDRATVPTALLLPSMGLGNVAGGDRERTRNYLLRRNKGKADAPLVFLCASPFCWLSHNAALEALEEGFTNVHWYRGGRAAWKAAGLPLVEAPLAKLPRPNFDAKTDAQLMDYLGTWVGRWDTLWSVRLTVEKGAFDTPKLTYEWEEKFGEPLRSETLGAQIDSGDSSMRSNTLTLRIDAKDRRSAVLTGQFGKKNMVAYLSLLPPAPQ